MSLRRMAVMEPFSAVQGARCPPGGAPPARASAGRSWGRQPLRFQHRRREGEPLDAADGVPTFRLRGYEADSVIAALTRWPAFASLYQIILSSDHDFLTLVSDRVGMYGNC